MMTWEEAVIWLRRQPDQAQLVRACYYDDPLLGAAMRFADSGEWCAVRALLPGPRGRALDLGAGRGIGSYALARDGWEVTAIEPDPSEIVGARAIRRLATEAGLKIDVVEQRAESLPFGDRTFDVVYGRQILHHATDLVALCQEIFRVLKPMGRFVATREHVISRSEDLAAFLKGHPLHHCYGGEHAYRLGEYLSALRRADLVIDLVLNPYESEINLFPDSFTDLRLRLARRIGWPWPLLIPQQVLKLLGGLDRRPGRLYTFFGHRGHGA